MQSSHHDGFYRLCFLEHIHCYILDHRHRPLHILFALQYSHLASCLILVLVATILICAFEQNNPTATFQAVLFETVSAMGTVGLSLGLTPTLSVPSRMIIIALMYAGRVGILTLGLAFSEKKHSAEVKKPVDTLLIG